MIIVKIPINRNEWYSISLTIREMLHNQGIKQADSEVHWMSGPSEIHVRLADGYESVASMLALQFTK
ncbi:MAG TPA: hypothetical protein VFM18_17155 [Methanosarcina sp.]|nr:hypothetical protein [Methanosarcina sp.]